MNRIVLNFVLVTLSLATRGVNADELTQQNGLVRQLLTPVASVIEGKPFRDSLVKIAEQSKINLCIDRRVDPTAIVNAGSVGPTVFGALDTIAKLRDCDVVPVGNVLLVGRPEWIDATMTSLLRAKPQATKRSVKWDELTTPNEALRIIGGTIATQIQLPHDLWPRNNWAGITTNEATALVLSQFDQRIDPAGNVVEATVTGSFKRSYESGSHSAAVRKLLKGPAVRGSVGIQNDKLSVTTNARGHRLVTQLVLNELSKSSKPKPPLKNGAKFTLNLKARAGDALNQFASTAGVKCVIEPAAINACQTIVTLSAKNKTIVELVDMVAKEAKLSATWTDDELRIGINP